MKILFSALGDTDPIRGCYDGACLHIVRHYQPEQVVLFYSADMEKKEKKDQRYTRALKSVAPKCEIKEIFSKIENVHIYDEFMTVLPDEVRRLHKDFPNAKILLNLSSGTPQIKTVLAILAVEEERWCCGVQVTSPEHGSNRNNPAVTDEEDVDALLNNNLDNEEETENRCSEPPIKILHYYGEKNRILSLIEQYAYDGALQLAKQSDMIPEETKKLLRHAAHRARLETDKAKDALRSYNGYHLFPFHDDEKMESLLEYFFTMQLAERQGDLSSLLLKTIPFLYTFLRQYLIEQKRLSLPSLLAPESKKLSRELMEKKAPKLLEFLNTKNSYPFTDSKLSYYLCDQICQYLEEKQLANNSEQHNAIMVELGKLRGTDIEEDGIKSKNKTNTLRNMTAHEIINVNEKKFRVDIGLSPKEFVNACLQLLRLYCEEKGRKIRNNPYDDLNEWIRVSLTKTE